MNTYAVIGLGYVGLGLAVALAQNRPTLGYDIDEGRINELQHHIDRNKLIDKKTLKQSSLVYTHSLEEIRRANFYIVSVATPAYFYEMPNLTLLTSACKALASIIKRDDIVVFESTVYPGTTEEICIPILEQYSHLKHGVDFHVGYSPERINPADERHTLYNITKIISAQNNQTLTRIQEAYQSICKTVYPVSSISTAEAIKVLENTLRIPTKLITDSERC